MNCEGVWKNGAYSGKVVAWEKDGLTGIMWDEEKISQEWDKLVGACLLWTDMSNATLNQSNYDDLQPPEIKPFNIPLWRGKAAPGAQEFQETHGTHETSPFAEIMLIVNNG